MSLSLEHVFHALSIALNSSSYPLSREALSNQLAEAYRVPETFRRYLIRHAPVEFAEAKGFFQSLFQPDDRARIMPAVEECIQSLTHLPARAATVRWREYRDHNIIWPLLTFRGIGFEAAILDERGVDHGFPTRRYDLMHLLRRGLFEEMDEEAYRAELERLAAKNSNWAKEAERERRFSKLIGVEPQGLLGVYGFFRLKGLLDKGRRIWFEVDEGKIAQRRNQVTVLEGIELSIDPPARVSRLVRHLRKKRLVTWFTDRHPTALRLGRALALLFEVNELRVRGTGGRLREAVWSIAFGQHSFFLDSLVWSQRPQSDAIIL